MLRQNQLTRRPVSLLAGLLIATTCQQSLADSPVRIAQTGQQESAAQLIERIHAKTDELRKVNALLSDADPSVRLAAFDAMLNSDNPIFRERAIEAGLGSDDADIEALALRAVFANMATIVIHVLDAGTLSGNGDQAPVAKASIPLDIREFDNNTGKMKLQLGGFIGVGQVNGMVFTFNMHHGKSTGTLVQNDELIMQGKVYPLDVKEPSPAMMYLR